MAMAVNTMLRGIIDDIEYDVELTRNCEDMKDQYYQGYVTALEYVAQHIVRKRLEYVGGNVGLENGSARGARCKALKSVAESIRGKLTEVAEELVKTTPLDDRRTLIGQIEAYATMLGIVNSMLPLASKPGQGADNAD